MKREVENGRKKIADDVHIGQWQWMNWVTWEYDII